RQSHLEPKVMDVLCALAARPGEVVSRQELIDKVWGVEFGGDEGLTRAISILRKVFDDAPGESQIIETVPKRGYRLVARVRFEPQDAGAVDADNAAAGKTAAVARRAARFAAGGAVLAAAILAFFAWRFAGADLALKSDRAPADAPMTDDVISIAVLPFASLSDDREDEYFAHGLSEELISVLGQADGLTVAGRTGAFYFKERQKPLPEIAEALNVVYVLDGSVRRDGENLRVIVQLIDSRDGHNLWAESFDGELKDIFAVQDAVAAEIVGAMKANFNLPETSAAPLRQIDAPVEAYDLYLQARAHLREVFAPGVSKPQFYQFLPAYRLLTEAIDIAPDFALAYASRAEAAAWINWVNTSGTIAALPDFKFPFPIEEATDRIDADIETALELGPDLAETHVSYRWHSSRWAGDDASDNELSMHIDAALRINPNHATARVVRSILLQREGQYREAFEETQRAYRLDPLNNEVSFRMFSQYVYFGDFENLEPFVNQSIEWTTVGGALTSSAFAHAEYGKFERLVEFERRGAEIPIDVETNWNAPQFWIGTVWSFGASYATLGIPEMARLRLRGLYDDIFLIREGRYDEAVEFLEAEWAIQSDPEKWRELRQPEWLYRVHDVHRSLAFAYLFTDDYKKIIEVSQQTQLFNLEPKPEGLPFVAGLAGPWIETSYAYALHQTGAENASAWMDEYVQALEHILAEGVALPNYEYEYARALTIQGRNEEAFAALERAIDKGWRRWYFEVDPITAPLREMLEFAGLKARYDADIARMRENVVKGLREQGFEIAD
ncbi:MAG: winged helix-turn-helix domain-containing protein, partial [Parvularculaceae bacterium]